MDINTAITELINKEKDKLGIPVTALANNTGIPYATLNRKTNGGGSPWTATEIARIAKALRVPSKSLFPSEFFENQAVAA